MSACPLTTAALELLEDATAEFTRAFTALDGDLPTLLSDAAARLRARGIDPAVGARALWILGLFEANHLAAGDDHHADVEHEIADLLRTALRPHSALH